MCVLRWIWAGLVCLGLSACSGLPLGGVSRSDVSGLAGGWSAVEIAHQPARTRHHVIYARGYSVRHGDAQAYSVRLGKAWDGIHGRLRVELVWAAGGRAMPFKPAGRTEPFTHDMASHHTAIGTLQLTAAEFTDAAIAGLDLRLTGPDGAFDIHLTPSLFAGTLRAGAQIPAGQSR